METSERQMFVSLLKHHIKVILAVIVVTLMVSFTLHYLRPYIPADSIAAVNLTFLVVGVTIPVVAVNAVFTALIVHVGKNFHEWKGSDSEYDCYPDADGMIKKKPIRFRFPPTDLSDKEKTLGYFRELKSLNELMSHTWGVDIAVKTSMLQLSNQVEKALQCIEDTYQEDTSSSESEDEESKMVESDEKETEAAKKFSSELFVQLDGSKKSIELKVKIPEGAEVAGVTEGTVVQDAETITEAVLRESKDTQTKESMAEVKTAEVGVEAGAEVISEETGESAKKESSEQPKGMKSE